MDNNYIVTFGKYNGKPALEVSQDINYCNWLLKQSNPSNKMKKLIEFIKSNRFDDQKSHKQIKENIIYVLELSQGKYYVGKTNDLNLRYSQHLNGEGSEWTKKYHPKSILNNFVSNSEFDEDITTKEYMKNYGIDNVRGGSYCQIDLDENLKKLIQREIYHSDNKCLICGGADHFVKNCTLNKKVNYCLPCFDITVELDNELIKHNMVNNNSEKLFKRGLNLYRRDLCENPGCMNLNHLAQRFYYLKVKYAYDRLLEQNTSQIFISCEPAETDLIGFPYAHSDELCEYCDNDHKSWSCPIIHFKAKISQVLITEFKEKTEVCFYCKGQCKSSIEESAIKGSVKNGIHSIQSCPKYIYDTNKNNRIGFMNLIYFQLEYVKSMEFSNVEEKKSELEKIKKSLLNFREFGEGKYLKDSDNHVMKWLFKKYQNLLKDVCDELAIF